MTTSPLGVGGNAMPNASPSSTKTPRKPEVTPATLEQLVEHYNAQVEPYNASLTKKVAAGSLSADELDSVLMERIEVDQLTKLEVIELIRRQNFRLGRFIKPRAVELLMARAVGSDGREVRDQNGRSVGLSYEEILRILSVEFPEGSTTAACLRWYVVHLRGDATEQGLPWPDLPQVRPRSKGKKHAG